MVEIFIEINPRDGYISGIQKYDRHLWWVARNGRANVRERNKNNIRHVKFINRDIRPINAICVI